MASFISRVGISKQGGRRSWMNECTRNGCQPWWWTVTSSHHHTLLFFDGRVSSTRSHRPTHAFTASCWLLVERKNAAVVQLLCGKQLTVQIGQPKLRVPIRFLVDLPKLVDLPVAEREKQLNVSCLIASKTLLLPIYELGDWPLPINLPTMVVMEQ